MKIKAYITTYNREEMLTELVDDLKQYAIEPTILDDGSSYKTNLKNYLRHKHRGKKGFWKTWDHILKDCKQEDYYTWTSTLYLFLPDDIKDINIRELIRLHHTLKDKPYCYNIINDGREKNWTGIAQRQIDESTIMCGYVDCGFFCNKEALDKIGYYVDEVPKSWFNKDSISSGVGYQLSKRFLKARVVMYKPVESLAYHGNHKSEMHPEERKKNPLISK